MPTPDPGRLPHPAPDLSAHQEVKDSAGLFLNSFHSGCYYLTPCPILSAPCCSLHSFYQCQRGFVERWWLQSDVGEPRAGYCPSWQPEFHPGKRRWWWPLPKVTAWYRSGPVSPTSALDATSKGKQDGTERSYLLQEYVFKGGGGCLLQLFFQSFFPSDVILPNYTSKLQHDFLKRFLNRSLINAS